MNAGRHVCGVALIRDDGATLLQLRDEKPTITDPGLWVLPGGHVEDGETPRDGAIREFLEETCYLCRELCLFMSCDARELGYCRDAVTFNFFWERFDGRQEIRCCEGQDLRFVKRCAAEGLPMPPYLPRIWDLALLASGVISN
jgi:8-oxo-dGTP pyrophosphatase MutT (NUDIX family)